jgi:hypothetical protein
VKLARARRIAAIVVVAVFYGAATYGLVSGSGSAGSAAPAPRTVTVTR